MLRGRARASGPGRGRERRRRGSAQEIVRRNKFSSPTEVSKRAGLIAGSFLIAGPGGWRAAASRRFFWWRASRDRDRDGGTSSVARASALLPPCGRSLTCIRTNRQKAGKGFSQTGAACVVVTPHAREEAAAAATRRETEPEAAMREVAARARARAGEDDRRTVRRASAGGEISRRTPRRGARSRRTSLSVRSGDERRRAQFCQHPTATPRRERTHVAAILPWRFLMRSRPRGGNWCIGRDRPSVTRQTDEILSHWYSFRHFAIPERPLASQPGGRAVNRTLFQTLDRQPRAERACASLPPLVSRSIFTSPPFASDDSECLLWSVPRRLFVLLEEPYHRRDVPRV